MSENQPPNNLPWALSQWHAISSGTSPLKMDGVLFQDILTILNNMLNIPAVRMWSETLAKMYDHLASSGNPHELTPDQFEIGILEYIYSVYLQHGYNRTYNEFILLIFTYVEILQFEDLLKDEIIVKEGKHTLSVKAASEYIKRHNSLDDVHDELFSRILPGETIRILPSLFYSKYYLDTSFDASKIYMFENSYYLPRKYSICIGSVFYNVNETIARIYSETSSDDYKINYSWNNKTIIVTRSDNVITDEVVFNIDVSEYILDDTDTSSRISCILMFDDNTISFILRLHTLEYVQDYYRETILIDGTSTLIKRNGNHTCLDVNTITNIPYKDDHNVVEYVTIYPTVLTMSQAKTILIHMEHPYGTVPFDFNP